MKRSLKYLMSALAALVVPAFGWAAEPWAAWTDFTGLTNSKAPDISSTQNSIAGSGFTFNLGSGVVQADGSIVTTGGSGAAPYIDFNQSINVGYNNNPITVVMTVEMPSALPTDVVKPLFFIGSNAPSGIGLTLKTLDETNGVTFGGAWEQEGSTWNTNNAGSGFTADAVKPSQVVTLSSSTSSGGLPLKVMVDGAMTSPGAISGLTGQSYNATRITLGNFHNTGTNTITYRIVNIAVFAGTSVSDMDVTLVATKPTVYARTLESSEETWSAADQWDGGSAPEGSPVAANLTVTAENGSTLNLDAAVTLFALEVSGSEKLTMTGSGLNTLKTTINTDTDVSGITADLGAVTIAEGATLYVGLNTKWTSVSGAGTIKIEDAVISLNIAKNFNGGVTNATSSDTQIAGLAPVPGAAWVNLSAAGGNSALSATEASAVYWNGSAAANLSDANVSDPYTVTYSANNTYQWTNPSDQFLDVYLDDGGAHAQIGVQKIPFSKYSVIVYCATDQASRKFSPVTMNGTMYTVDETGVTKTTTAATDTFGACYGLTAQYANTTAGNAIRIDNLSGALSIVGGGNANNARGGIAAIQIVNTGDIVKYATVAKTLTEDATYSALIDTAEDVETVTADITIADGKTLTIDKVPAVGELTVKTQSASDVVTVKIDLADPVQIREVLDLLDTDSSSGLVKMTLATYTGKAAWMAYEFNGDYTNTGSEGTSLSWDGGGAFGNGTGNYTSEMMTAAHTDADEKGNSALRLPARPYRHVTVGYPAAFTAVMYAKAGTTANGVLVSFGSATGGQKNTVTLATGANPDKDEMRLVQCGDLQSVATDLVQNLAVPNSQKSNHLYAFAMYTQDGKTRAEVYVDGELLTTYTFDSVITLGTGLQVGSIHGGAGASGLQALAFEKDESGNLTSYDPATMDFIRVYDCLLSEEMLQTMAAAYPYTSPSGTATRELDGSAANWVEDDDPATAWSQATLNADGTSAIAEQNAPNAGTNIVLTATEATNLTINLPEDTTAYETLTINGDVTLVAEEGTEVLSVSGRTTINGNVTMPYNLVHLSTVTVKAGNTLTIDASSIDLSKVYANQTIGLTGMIDKEDGATVTVKLPMEVTGRTAVATQTESGYVLTITVDGELNAYIPAAGATWETLTWRLGETEIDKPADLTGLAVLLTVAEGATLTLTEDVAAGSYTLVDNLTVSGAMLNGLTLGPGVVLTTDVGSFTMGSVKAATSVTKDTRPMVILTADTVSLTGAQKSKDEAWHNINLTIPEGTTCNYPGDRNDWTGSTITVAGTFNAASAQIWLGVTYDSLADADTKLIVSGTATINEVMLGGWGNTTGNAIEVTGAGSLTINTLTLHAATTVAVSVAETASLTVNGTAKGDSWAEAIANVTINGTAKWVGTITGTLALNSGATLDATAGALTVGGAVTFPTEGTVTVKADEVGTFLSYTGDAPENTGIFSVDTTLENARVGVTKFSTNVSLFVAQVAKPEASDTLTDAEADEVAQLITNTFGVYEKAITEIRNPEGAILFDGATLALDEENGVVTVGYKFGITDIVRNDDSVTITAQVLDADDKAAGFAEDVTVELEDIKATETVIDEDAGTATFTVPLANLLDENNNAKPIKVKASKASK